MSAVREAIVLPVLFLTVTVLGGIKLAAGISLVAPPVLALVLGILLVRLVVQSGALAPGRLLSGNRGGLANVNGALVLLTLWLAASQTLAMLIPSSGLPRVALSFFLLVLLVNTAAAAPDRQRLLRSLAVTFGAAFLLKFVILQELSTPGEGGFKRLLHALLDNITLGVLMQEVHRPAAGYLAFAVLALFIGGVFLLPPRHTGALARRPDRPLLADPDL